MSFRTHSFALSVAFAAGVVAPASSAARDKLLVVVNRAEERVSIFKAEGTALTLLKALPIGKASRELCLSPDGQRAYVSATEGNSVTVVDLDGLAVVATIALPGSASPDGCVVSPDSAKVYVTAPRRNSVLVIAAPENKILKEIPVPLTGPRRVTFTPDGKRLAVGPNSTPEIGIIDAINETVIRTIKVGSEPRGGPAFTPDGKTLLVGNIEDDTVSFVDMGTFEVSRVMGVPLSPQRVAVSKDGEFAYVLAGAGHIDAAGNAHASLFRMPLKQKHDASRDIPFGKSANGAGWGLALNDAGTLAYLSSYKGDELTVLDLATMSVVGSAPSKDPNGIAFRP